MKKSNASILFIQLPLLNHSHDYILGNLEYAPGAISGYIEKEIKGNLEIFCLPFLLSNYASDIIITDYVCSLQPDIAAFTCYAWNIERSLCIAKNIKERLKDIVIICGGPEIQPGSISLAEHHAQIDLFVTGEGEWFFENYLKRENIDKYSIIENKNKIVVQPQDCLIPSEKIFEPYTGNRINIMPDGSMFFEMTRGCPYRCSYCLYAKNSKIIREVEFNTLLGALQSKKKNRNLSELYLLAPALEVTKGFLTKLELLANLNHGIRLHSEMRAERVTLEQAQLLYRAGFRSLEVGLQTLNTTSLRNVGRNSDPKKELEGVCHLKKAGIDIKLGIIPGLPGDTPESFISMIDQLTDMGLHDSIELYPLMILPGTEIRDYAIRDQINFLKKPPYYYNYGWGISFDDLKNITRYLEERTGYTHLSKRLPDFTSNDSGLYCKGISIDGTLGINWNIKNYISYIQASVFSFYITVDKCEIIYDNLHLLLCDLPTSELFNVILYCNGILEENKIMPILEQYEGDHLLRRINIFHDWKHGFRVRLYQVFDTFRLYEKAQESYGCIVPILQLNKHNLDDLDKLTEYEDNVLLPVGIFHLIKKKLMKFSDSPESLAFEETSEQKEFYSMIGLDYIQLPFDFKINKV